MLAVTGFGHGAAAQFAPEQRLRGPSQGAIQPQGGARLLEIVSRSNDPSALLNALPTSFSTPELNVTCAEGEPHSLTAQLQELAASTFAAPAHITTIDGLRVDWADGFGLIRASNTTPVLVLRFEGHTPQALARITQEMLALLHRVKPDAVIGDAAH